VVCPYAKNIRGTIAFCTLINKKVSTLRFPCKGNYTRCPIYQRYATAAAPAPSPGAPQPPSVEKEEKARAAPPTPPPRKAGPVARPSEALCDSLVLAALITSGSAEDRYRDSVNGLLDYLKRKYSGTDKLVFVVGSLADGTTMRLLAWKGKLVYSFERDGTPICGEDSEKLFKEVGSSSIDAIIYSVEWENIPLWGDLIRKELS
jgi:hypothetical protein